MAKELALRPPVWVEWGQMEQNKKTRVAISTENMLSYSGETGDIPGRKE